MNIRRVDGVVVVVVVVGLATVRGEDCTNVEFETNGLLLGINLNLPPSPLNNY